MSTYQNYDSKAEAYRAWRDENNPDLEALAAKVGVAHGGGLNTQLNRPTMNAKLRKKCIEAGIPEDVLPAATKTKGELEAELQATKVQLTQCWDALDGLCSCEVAR